MKSKYLIDYDHIRKSSTIDRSKNMFNSRNYASYELNLSHNNLDKYLESGIWYNTLSEATNVLQLMQDVSEMTKGNPLLESKCADRVNRFLLTKHIVHDWANVYKVNENSDFILNDDFKSFLEYTNELSYDVKIYDVMDKEFNIENILYSIVSSRCPIESMRLMDELLDKIEDSNLIKDGKVREGVISIVDHFINKKKISTSNGEYLRDLVDIYFFMHHHQDVDMSDKPKFTSSSVLVLGSHEVVKGKSDVAANTRLNCSILSIFTKYLPTLNTQFATYLNWLKKEIKDNRIAVEKNFVELFMNTIPYISTPEIDDAAGEIIELINPDKFNIKGEETNKLEDFLNNYIDGRIDDNSLSKLISDFSDSEKNELGSILSYIDKSEFMEKVTLAYSYEPENTNDIYIKQARCLYILIGLLLSDNPGVIYLRSAKTMIDMLEDLLENAELNDEERQLFTQYNLTLLKVYRQGCKNEIDTDVEEDLEELDDALLKNIKIVSSELNELATVEYIGLKESASLSLNDENICTYLINIQRNSFSGDKAVLFYINQMILMYDINEIEGRYKFIKNLINIAKCINSEPALSIKLADKILNIIISPGIKILNDSAKLQDVIFDYADLINRISKTESCVESVYNLTERFNELLAKLKDMDIETGFSNHIIYLNSIKSTLLNPKASVSSEIPYAKYMIESEGEVKPIENIDQAIGYLVSIQPYDNYNLYEAIYTEVLEYVTNAKSLSKLDISKLYYATVLSTRNNSLTTAHELITLLTNRAQEATISESVDDPFDNNYFDIDTKKKDDDEDDKDIKPKKKPVKKSKVEDDDEDEDDDIDDEDEDDEDFDDDDEDWDDEADEDWDTYNEDPDKAVKETFDPNIDRVMVEALVEAELIKSQYRYYKNGLMRLFTLTPAEKIRMGLNGTINESLTPSAIMKQHIDIYLTNYDKISEATAIKLIHEKSDKKLDVEGEESKGKLSKTAKAIGKKGVKVIKKSHELGQKTSDNFQQFAADFGIIKRQATSAIHKVGDLDKRYSDRLDTMFDRTFLKLKKNVANKNREAVLKGSLLPSLSSMIKLGTTAGALTALGQPILGLITLVGGVGVSAKATKEERIAIADELTVQQKIVDKKLAIADSDNDVETYAMLLKIKNRIIKEKARLTYKTNSARTAMRKSEWDKGSND